MEYTLARNAAEDLTKGLGRRGFMRQSLPSVRA